MLATTLWSLMKDLIEKLIWYKSNLNVQNLTELDILIEEIKQKLPENYQIKLQTLSFYELINDEPSNDLPF
jgi:hypothetical protein